MRQTPVAVGRVGRHNASMIKKDERITVPAFTAMKQAGHKITMVTAYDYPMAELVDAAGVEGILVGDSGLKLVGHDPILEILALLGFAYLMFLSGLRWISPRSCPNLACGGAPGESV